MRFSGVQRPSVRFAWPARPPHADSPRATNGVAQAVRGGGGSQAHFVSVARSIGSGYRSFGSVRSTNKLGEPPTISGRACLAKTPQVSHNRRPLGGVVFTRPHGRNTSCRQSTIWRDGRVVYCTGLLSRSGVFLTAGSNPVLSATARCTHSQRAVFFGISATRARCLRLVAASFGGLLHRNLHRFFSAPFSDDPFAASLVGNVLLGSRAGEVRIRCQ